MNAEIICVGTEILLGDILNTNSQFLAKELATLGITMYFQSVVGDNPERLKEAVYSAFKRSDLVITTGGLGPTADDLTKETCAGYFGKKLVMDERAFKRLENYFTRTGRKMTPNNIKQAYVPEGAIVLYNDYGTAPGVIVEDKGKILVMIPGPPKEAEPMFNEQVKKYLEQKQEYTLVSRILRVAEIGESSMETMVRDIIDAQTNPTIAPYAKPLESFLRITAKAHNKEEAEKLIDPVADKIYERLGASVYAEGETDMETVTAKLLMEKGLTLATAESCTGGLLASAFVEYPGISKVFTEGAVTYSNAAKIRRLGVKEETIEKFGPVSPDCAAEMARGAAETSFTDIGLSTTGIAGPNGGSKEKPVGLVYIGLYIKGETKTKEIHIAGTRQRIREKATYSALNFLREELGKL